MALYCMEKVHSIVSSDLVFVVPCRKFSLDDLLTNVMIYWMSGCIVSSMRFYKENFRQGLNQPHSK